MSKTTEKQVNEIMAATDVLIGVIEKHKKSYVIKIALDAVEEENTIEFNETTATNRDKTQEHVTPEFIVMNALCGDREPFIISALNFYFTLNPDIWRAVKPLQENGGDR